MKGISCQHVNPAGSRVFMGTLTEGVNIHDAVAAVAKAHEIKTATFELLGGLNIVELTAYDLVTRTRLPALTYRWPLEIVAGHGTISQLDGDLHVHIHMTLASRDEEALEGISVIGGHVQRAEALAVEYTLTAYDGNPVRRALHVGTGLQLWQMEPLDD